VPIPVRRLCPAPKIIFISFGPRALAVIAGFTFLFLPLRSGTADVSDGRASVWNRGERLMDAGHVFQGILLLDSLRRSGFDDPGFLSDYSRRVFHALVPRLADSSITLLRNPDSASDADSVLPDRISWKVTAGSHSLLPVFQYGATFTYRKPFKLFFGGLAPGGGDALLSDPEMPRQLRAQAALSGELGDRSAAADCNVWIDLNDAKLALMEYIGRRISGLYDSIATTKDLARYHAVSLRCFRRSFTYGRDGEFAAYVVFDRTLGDLLRARGVRCADRSDSGRKIRFTAAVRSVIDLQSIAEERLQSVLRSF
jgi:hypothetical protein